MSSVISMAHRQTWSLSQDANKSSGVCSSCHAVRQLHIKDGTIHRHGPRSKPCDGSDKPPLSAQSTSFQSAPYTPSGTAGDFSPSAAMSLASSFSSIASSLSTLAERSSVFSHPQIDSALIKRIPKSARPACASLLANLLHGVTDNLFSLEPWSDLLHFGERVLRKPDRTGRRHNLASVIKKRTEGTSPSDKQAVKRVPVRKSRNDDELLAAAVTAKVEDGNIKAAVRLLCSEERPASDTAATYLKLLERHPAPPAGRCLANRSHLHYGVTSDGGEGTASHPFVSSGVFWWPRWHSASTHS